MKVIGLWSALRSLRGNQRACVIAEPLWAIPYQLFLPFASIYMSALGVADAQIGWIASLSLAVQFFWGLLSGAIVDKYGRRATMLVFGLMSWTIPCALWALARDYRYFAVAALINGAWRVTGNSFSCLIIEGGDRDKLIQIHTLLNVIGLIAGFLSPIVGFFIDRFSLVGTMRAIYFAAMALMTARFVLQYRLTRESEVGVHKMVQCRGRSVPSLAFGGWRAFKDALRIRRLRLCAILAVLGTCVATIQASFWPLFVKAEYGVSDSMLALFPFVKSAVTLVVYLAFTSRIQLSRVRRPLLVGLGAQGLGYAALLARMQPSGAALWAVFLSAACDAFALAMLAPLSESLMSRSIPDAERARINSMVFASILLISAPAGWIAGQLAEVHRALPLAMNLCLICVEMVIAVMIAREVSYEFQI
ncbi:MAG: MFS transporter [Christensenellales bacterium]|jgi:MFS family permease